MSSDPVDMPGAALAEQAGTLEPFRPEPPVEPDAEKQEQPHFRKTTMEYDLAVAGVAPNPKQPGVPAT